MKIHISKNTILHKFAYRLIYKICIDLAYIYCIAPFWGYTGYFSYEFSFWKLIVGYLFFWVLCIVTPVVENSISAIFFNTQLYVSITPMITLYTFAGNDFNVLVIILLIVAEEAILYKFVSRITTRTIKIANTKLMQSIKYMLFIIVLITLLITLRKVGFSNGFDALDFFNIYSIRDTTKENMGVIESYLLPWSTKVILPFFITYYLYYRDVTKVVVLSMLQVYFYLAYANKFVLFTLLLIFCLYYIIDKNRIRWIYEKGLSLFVIAITLYDCAIGSWSLFSSLFIRRVFFIPAMVKFTYYEYFKIREKVHYADGLVGKILGIESPYSKTIPNLIGEYLGSGGYMNTGYLGETYANAGVIGLIVVAFLIVIYLCLLEKFSEKIDFRIILTSAFYTLYAFNEGAFLTLMLTYGGILLLFIFYSVNNNSSYT